MSTHNMFSLRNKKNVNFRARNLLDKWILTTVCGQVIEFDNSITLINVSQNVTKTR